MDIEVPTYLTIFFIKLEFFLLFLFLGMLLVIILFLNSDAQYFSENVVK